MSKLEKQLKTKQIHFLRWNFKKIIFKLHLIIDKSIKKIKKKIKSNQIKKKKLKKKFF